MAAGGWGQQGDDGQRHKPLPGRGACPGDLVCSTVAVMNALCCTCESC